MAVISDAGLARIIAAVGTKATEWPIDGDGLRGCLKLAYRRYRDAVRYTSTASYKTQLRRLTLIRKTAKRLELLIGSVDIREWAEDGPPSPSNRFTTTDLVTAIDEQLKSWSEPDEVIIRSFEKYNPFDWMIGVYLADVYEFIFRGAATITENGPFIRFAEAALRELVIKKSNGENYKRTSILKSLTTVRGGKLRRKVKPGEPYSHWSLSQLARAYRELASFFRQNDDTQDDKSVEIVDHIALGEYLLSRRDPNLMALLLGFAQEDLAPGKSVPGISATSGLDLDNWLEDIEQGKSEQ